MLFEHVAAKLKSATEDGFVPNLHVKLAHLDASNRLNAQTANISGRLRASTQNSSGLGAHLSQMSSDTSQASVRLPPNMFPGANCAMVEHELPEGKTTHFFVSHKKVSVGLSSIGRLEDP